MRILDHMIVLIRHGETEWSAAGKHTSRTDIELTAKGERAARTLAPFLARRRFAAVLSSPRKRALRTAELAGIAVTEVLDDLAEWDYGGYEGQTTAEIRESRPDWLLWRDGAPGGESPDQVTTRLDRVLAEAAAYEGDVLIFGHGHALRVAGARWIGLPTSAGQLLRLDTATLSELGYEHEWRVIRQWNAPVPA